MRLSIGVGLGAALGGVALALAACDSGPSAPSNIGYCWRMTTNADGKVDFKPVSSGVQNLETCAAHLEAVTLREHRTELTGAFQSQFIFITPAMVQSSMRLKGVRYRLFDADTRAKIDRDLSWMLQDEKHPSRFGPQTPGIGASRKP